MNMSKNRGPIIEQGLCRCCGTIKRCRILNIDYEWQGQKEVYSDMFMDCFGLLLSHLDGDELERVICATCVTRLRDATAFKHQVLQCENNLLKNKIQFHGEDSSKLDLKTEVKVENLESALNPKMLLEQMLCESAHSDDDGCPEPMYDDMSDIEPMKVKGKSAKKKKLLKSKLSKVKSKVKGEYLKRKRELRDKLRTEEDIVIHESQEIPPTQPRPKIIETEMKAFTNTITIVENSYVCPFYTSFSDYYCIYCRDTFTDPTKLRDHTLEHDPTSFRDILFENKKIAQVDIARVDCRLCPLSINDVEVLKDHLQSVHGKFLYPITNEFLKFRLTINQLTCTECNRSFKFFHALKKHMAEHFGTCICDVCGAHYFEERILLIHQKKHQETKAELHSCSYCEKSFKSRHNRYLHEAKVHKKESAYPCSKCDEIFFTYTLRYRHLIEIHGEERKYPCDTCGRIYDSRKSLREHNRRSHLKIMKHQCDLCDRRFYLPSRLKEHMSTHTGERNYRCEYCGKSYPRLRGLKVHMQSHSTEKRYRCMLCNASFTQNVNLKNHMKRQHQSLDMDENEYQNDMMLNVK